MRDLFSSHGLNFLRITENWISASEYSALVKLLPSGCSDFSSFEVISFEMGCSDPVVCAVIYQPPKYNKDFVSDFSDFLPKIMPKYDRALFAGDFNIHMCW